MSPKRDLNSDSTPPVSMDWDGFQAGKLIKNEYISTNEYMSTHHGFKPIAKKPPSKNYRAEGWDQPAGVMKGCR